MAKWLGISLVALSAVAFVGYLLVSRSIAQEKAKENAVAPSHVLAYTMTSLDGQEIDLKTLEGKVLLIVNVASRCGLTPQYEALEELHKKYADKGFAVIGFPCNQFLGQEPGSAEQIKEFCSTKYGVTFPMFSKVEVKGAGACELYQQLSNMDLAPAGPGPISWNFEKFIIGRNGVPVARFAPRTKPDSEEVIKVLEEQLAVPTT
jgi:glutathione peroxidase